MGEGEVGWKKGSSRKTYGGVIVQIRVFLASALVMGERSASRPGRITQGEEPPATHWIGGWIVFRAGLDDREKGKFLTAPELELRFRWLPDCSQLGIIGRSVFKKCAVALFTAFKWLIVGLTDGSWEKSDKLPSS
jgi:hypothetical protein